MKTKSLLAVATIVLLAGCAGKDSVRVQPTAIPEGAKLYVNGCETGWLATSVSLGGKPTVDVDVKAVWPTGCTLEQRLTYTGGQTVEPLLARPESCPNAAADYAYAQQLQNIRDRRQQAALMLLGAGALTAAVLTPKPAPVTIPSTIDVRVVK